MNDSSQFTTDSNTWYHFTKKVNFTLHEKEITYRLDKQRQKKIHYGDIASIRLNYWLGGKNAPNKYCCTIYTIDKNCYTIAVADKDKLKDKKQEYKAFIESLKQKIQTYNPQASMLVGYNKTIYRMQQLVIGLVLLIWTAVIIYFFTEDGRKEIGGQPFFYFIAGIMFIILLSRLYYLQKYKPQQLRIFDSIPTHVFPK